MLTHEAHLAELLEVGPALEALGRFQHVQPVPFPDLLLLFCEGTLVVGQMALLLLPALHLYVGPSGEVLLGDQLPLGLDALHADLVPYPRLLRTRLLVEPCFLPEAKTGLVVEFRHAFGTKMCQFCR